MSLTPDLEYPLLPGSEKMNTNPSYYDEEIQELCKDISKKILKLNKGMVEGKNKQDFMREIEEDIKKSQRIFKAMYRLVSKDGVDQTWKKKLAVHKGEISNLQHLLETAKEKSSKEELLGTSLSEKKKPDPKKKPKKAEDDDEVVEVVASDKALSGKQKNDALADELFKEIYETQGDSLEIVKRLIDKADDTKAVAADSMEMLKKQREQLERIDKEMDELGSNITRGTNEIKSFMRRLATDKVIIILILLVVLAVLAIIIWRIVDYVLKKFGIDMYGGGGSNTGGTVKPESSIKPSTSV